MRSLYIAVWNFQNRHTTPRWVSETTGECVSHIGRLLSGWNKDSWAPLG